MLRTKVRAQHRKRLLKVPSLAGVVRPIDGEGKMNPRNIIVMNTYDTATLLGISTSTLAKMRLYGTGPNYSKLGRRVVYKQEELEAWITENRFKSTSEYPQKMKLRKSMAKPDELK